MTVARPSLLRSARTRVPAPAVESARWPVEWSYFSFVVAAWCFAPLVRRLVDYHAGAFDPVPFVSLVPYVAMLPLAFLALRPERWARLTRVMRWLSCLWVATFGYGFLIAVVSGTIGAAAFTLLEYLVPMLAGIWIAGLDISLDAALRRMFSIVLPCATLVALYGLAQWMRHRRGT